MLAKHAATVRGVCPKWLQCAFFSQQGFFCFRILLSGCLRSDANFTSKPKEWIFQFSKTQPRLQEIHVPYASSCEWACVYFNGRKRNQQSSALVRMKEQSRDVSNHVFSLSSVFFCYLEIPSLCLLCARQKLNVVPQMIRIQCS